MEEKAVISCRIGELLSGEGVSIDILWYLKNLPKTGNGKVAIGEVQEWVSKQKE